MAQFGNVCFRPVSARFLNSATIVSSFIAQSARFRLPAGSRISAITSTLANDAVFADINAQIPNSLEAEVFDATNALVETREPIPGSSDFTRTITPQITSTRTIFTLTQDYETDDMSRLNDLSDLNSGLSLQIWGNGDPNNPATATVVEGGNFPPVEIENVISITGAVLESDAWFTRRIENIASVRRLEFDFDCNIFNRDNSGNALPREVRLAAQIRFAGETTWRRLLVGDGLQAIGDTGNINAISVRGTAEDNGRGSVFPELETDAQAIPVITDPITGDIFQSTFRFVNGNFNPMRVTMILPDFNVIERSRGSVEVRFRPEARDESGRHQNTIRLEGIKVVRIDSDESREDYIWQHRLGLNLVASATLTGTPEAANAILTSESFYFDPDATFAAANTAENIAAGQPRALEVIYRTDSNGEFIVENGLFVVHPDNDTLTRDSNGNVTNVPADGAPNPIGYWSMNNPRYITPTGHTDGAYRATSNPAELLLTFALGQRVNAREGAESNNRLIWGLGLPIDRINLGSLADWRDYCIENTLEFNGFFNEGRTAFEILDAIAAVGHGLISWADGRLTIAIDEPYATPSFVLDESKIVAGSFRCNYEMIRKYDAIEAVYNNAANDYQEETIREDAPAQAGSTGAVANERFFGTTDETQARNRARRFIRHNTFRTPREYEFRLAAQDAYLTIGDSVLIRHRFFGDDAYHKLKVFAVRYSSQEEITVSAAPDSFRVWLDREESVESRLIDFSTDLPLVIGSAIRDDSLADETDRNSITTTDGMNWTGELAQVHEGHDFRINDLEVTDDNGRDIVSLDFSRPNLDYTRGAASTAFEYRGFPTEEESGTASDGASWTFASPVNFSLRGRNFSISRVSLDAVSGNIVLRDNLITGKTAADYNGISLTMDRMSDGSSAADASITETAPVTLDLDESNVLISQDSASVMTLLTAATTEDLRLTLRLPTFTILETRSALPIFTEDSGNLVNGRIDFTFNEPISFEANVAGEDLAYIITGFTLLESGAFIIRSPNFIPESTTAGATNADQLQRLVDANVSFSISEAAISYTASTEPDPEVDSIIFRSGEMEILYRSGNINSSNVRILITIIRDADEPSSYTLEVNAQSAPIHSSEFVRATNIFLPIATSWNIFPRISFTDQNRDFDITGLEFIDRPGGDVLIRLSDSQIVGKAPANYGGFDIRIGDIIVPTGGLPGGSFRFVDTDGDVLPGTNLDVTDDATARLEINLTPSGRTPAPGIQALRTLLEESLTQEISIEILGVTQPAIDPLARAMRNTRGNPLELEMQRLNSSGEIQESVPLRIMQQGNADSRQFTLNFEARDTTDSRRIRFLGNIPSGESVRIAVPRTSIDNVKVPLGAVYEGRCPVYLVTANHARILLARGNKEIQPMLDEIDRLAGADTDFYAIDIYRNQVPAGRDADGNNISAHAIILRGSEELATLLRTGYTITIEGLVGFPITVSNTSYQDTNVEEGAGVVFNVEDFERTGSGSLTLPPETDPDARNEEVERRAALAAENAISVLFTRTSAHINLTRNTP